MYCLGIESTAHTFGIGIVNEKGEILSDARDSYKARKGWGIIPIEAGRHHEKVKGRVLQQALKKAKLKIQDIDYISFAQGPGLPPCLRVGKDFAKKLARENKKPLVPVNHCIAHIEIGREKTKSKDPVVVYVSGANTQIISHVSGKYRIFGETQDTGLGNAIDKFGRDVGLGFPAGMEIEKLAKKGSWIELPYTVKGMDLVFSGIVTDAIRKAKKEKLVDVCFSLQETLFAMLTEVTERALAHVGKKEVLVTGGVGANKRLAQMMEIMCRERGAQVHIVPLEYSGDNGSMIAWAGICARKNSLIGKEIEEVDIQPNQRTDDVEINWL